MLPLEGHDLLRVALFSGVGFKHAAAALARKLAVVLHAMWRSNTPFQAWPA